MAFKEGTRYGFNYEPLPVMVKKKYSSDAMSSSRVMDYDSVLNAVKAAGGRPVEIFEITTNSLGWHKEKFEFEKCSPPDQPAIAASRSDDDDEDTE